MHLFLVTVLVLATGPSAFFPAYKAVTGTPLDPVTDESAFARGLPASTTSTVAEGDSKIDNDILQKALDLFIIFLNQNVQSMIEDGNLDPLDTIVEDNTTLGRVNLGVCKPKAKASYKVGNMRGLSSLQFSDAVILSSTLSHGMYTGELFLKANLSSDLKADVKGSVRASCGRIRRKMNISGTAKAEKGRGTCKATYAVEFGHVTETEQFKIKKLKIDYHDISIKIKGLGIFNGFLEPLQRKVNFIFGSAIKGALSSLTQNELNKLIAEELPLVNV